MVIIIYTLCNEKAEVPVVSDRICDIIEQPKTKPTCKCKKIQSTSIIFKLTTTSIRDNYLSLSSAWIQSSHF